MPTNTRTRHLSIAIGIIEKLPAEQLKGCFPNNTAAEVRAHLRDLRGRGLAFMPCRCQTQNPDGSCIGWDKDTAENSTAAADLGRLGGQKRAANLTAARRREIGQKAIAARWAKQKDATTPAADQPPPAPRSPGEERRRLAEQRKARRLSQN